LFVPLQRRGPTAAEAESFFAGLRHG
jgi:hypothetical protein